MLRELVGEVEGDVAGGEEEEEEWRVGRPEDRLRFLGGGELPLLLLLFIEPKGEAVGLPL